MLLSRGLLIFAFLLALAACSTPAPTKPPSTPPTPKSVTSKNPGGDANDPELAALERLTREPWGHRRDRWSKLHIPLVDWKNWTPFNILGNPTRASLRYGKPYYAVATIWYTPIEGPNEPEACLAKFIDQATPIADAYGVRIGERQHVRLTQSVGAEVKPMAVELLEGRMDSLLGRDDYVGAVAAYQSFPGTCLVEAFAAVSTNHRELAIKVRDRWVAEGAAKLVWERHVKEAPEMLSR